MFNIYSNFILSLSSKSFPFWKTFSFEVSKKFSILVNPNRVQRYKIIYYLVSL